MKVKIKPKLERLKTLMEVNREYRTKDSIGAATWNTGQIDILLEWIERGSLPKGLDSREWERYLGICNYIWKGLNKPLRKKT